MEIEPTVTASMYRSSVISSSIDIPLVLSGGYELQALDRSGKIVRSRKCKNAITEAGIRRITNSGSGLAWSNLAIAELDTGATFTTSNLISTATLNRESLPFRTVRTSIFEFTPGSVVGRVVKVGTGATGVTFSTSNVRTEQGELTYFEVRSDERFRVVYDISLSIPSQIFQFNLNFAGTPVLCSLRAQSVVDTSFDNPSPATNVGWNLNGSLTISGGRTIQIASSSTTGAARPRAYTDTILSDIDGPVRNIGNFANNSATIVETIDDSDSSVILRMIWQPVDGNVAGGIGRICFRTGGTQRPTTNWNMVFSPKIPKDDFYALQFDIRLNFTAGE